MEPDLPASKDPRRQYLKLRGATWFLNYPIPSDVRAEFLSEGGKPRTHIVQTTGTTDLNEAHRTKFGLIQRLEIEFSKARRATKGTLTLRQCAAALSTERLAGGGEAQSVLIDGAAYLVPMEVAGELLRLHLELRATPHEINQELERQYLKGFQAGKAFEREECAKACEAWSAKHRAPEAQRKALGEPSSL